MPQHLTSGVIPWRPIEQHPQIQAFLTARLADHQGWSIRDAKRLLNVWQLHERLLAAASPITDPDARLERAEHLILLAEIITRWPSLQRSLHSAYPAGRGLQVLAAAADDDTAWTRAVTEVVGDRAIEPDALPELRRLLRLHAGLAVARLAATLS
ncbi:hypothetical protein [Dactylosporangium matsuzakiense]|uniref:Uncharacterized protein n=1 Tax=Dactylosporangium matsuzakiense TaxID=53360 RepID=A0A9W6KER8_9ACTN|nr:hypothetical protein [Dactylosporangium matsuzakiense]GLK99373.1 hypothetical protein GCM10017581_011140 [Dactylosporangium matsuzakiense]